MKRKQTKTIVALIAIMTVMLSSSLSYAYQFRGGDESRFSDEQKEEMKARRQKAKESFIEELGLEPEQVEVLDKYREEHKGKNKQAHEDLKKLKKALQEEIAKPESNPGTIRAITSEIKQIQAALVDVRTENILKIKEVLTPEQFEKFQKHHEKMKEKKTQRRKQFKKQRYED